MQLACLNKSMDGRGLTSSYSGISRNHTWSPRGLLVRRPYLWGQIGEGTCSYAIQDPPSFTKCQGSTEYWILILVLTPLLPGFSRKSLCAYISIDNALSAYFLGSCRQGHVFLMFSNLMSKKGLLVFVFICMMILNIFSMIVDP